MLISYNFNNAAAVVTAGEYIWVIFDTNPGTVIRVAKSAPATVLDTIILAAGCDDISGATFDESTDNLWIICETAPGIAVIINTLDWESIGGVTYIELTNPYPSCIITSYVYLTSKVYIGSSTSPATMEILNANTGVYYGTVNLDGNNCTAITTSWLGSYLIWGTLYSSGETGETAGRVFYYDGDAEDLYTGDIEGITGLTSIAVDIAPSPGVGIVVGNGESPAKIATGFGLNFPTGLTIDFDTVDVQTLDTDENNLVDLTTDYSIYPSIAFYGVTQSPIKILEFIFDTGSVLNWTPVTILETDILLTSSVLHIDEGGIRYVSIDGTPGKLYWSAFSPSCSYLTDTRTKTFLKKVYFTLLNVVNRVKDSFLTDLRLQIKTINSFFTDFRLADHSALGAQPKSLTSFLVKKNGIDLVDVSYDSLKITYNLNRTPSKVEFVLARRHDRLNYTLSGDFSQITNENKIQVYDDTRLLFTGYITTITAQGDQDIVSIVAEDVRYKISKVTMELAYGAKFDYPDNLTYTGDGYPISPKGFISISTKTAIELVFTEISSLISGYDRVDFSFIPEYTKEYNDCSNFIDTLTQISGNINWYVDENEKIRFQKVALGTVKVLNLSGLSVKRNLYDIVNMNINLNKKSDQYYTAYELKFGKLNTKFWSRGSGAASTNQLQHFAFQEFHRWGGTASYTTYVGMRDTVDSYFYTDSWFRGYFIYQWLNKDTYIDIPSQTIGTGAIKKTVNRASYGKKITNARYEEKSKDDLKKIWVGIAVDGTDEDVFLCSVREEFYDQIDYAKDAAAFELSQNNVLVTDATVNILLDAIEYHNIVMKDLINIGNTIEAGIYSNSNGFPLNISSMTIDCSTRIVTLNLTNYGKTWYKRTKNHLTNYTSEYIKILYKRVPMESFSGL
jgi:hypothetical protein